PRSRRVQARAQRTAEDARVMLRGGAALALFVLALVLTPGDDGAEIKVTPLVSEGHVSASFAAAAAFNDDSREVVKSGLPLTFTYVVELRRPSTVWWDRTLGTATVSASVKFDNLT